MWICGYSKWSQTVDRLSVRGGYSWKVRLTTQAGKHLRDLSHESKLSYDLLSCFALWDLAARCEQTRLWTGKRNSLSCWQILAQILVSICQKIRAPSEIQFISLFGFSAAAPDGGRALLWQYFFDWILLLDSIQPQWRSRTIIISR